MNRSDAGTREGGIFFWIKLVQHQLLFIASLELFNQIFRFSCLVGRFELHDHKIAPAWRFVGVDIEYLTRKISRLHRIADHIYGIGFRHIRERWWSLNHFEKRPVIQKQPAFSAFGRPQNWEVPFAERLQG